MFRAALVAALLTVIASMLWAQTDAPKPTAIPCFTYQTDYFQVGVYFDLEYAAEGQLPKVCGDDWFYHEYWVTAVATSCTSAAVPIPPDVFALFTDTAGLATAPRYMVKKVVAYQCVEIQPCVSFDPGDDP